MTKDFGGNQIEVGDLVAGCRSNTLFMGVVASISDKGNCSLIPLSKNNVETWKAETTRRLSVIGRVKHAKLSLEMYAEQDTFKAAYDQAMRIVKAKLRASDVRKRKKMAKEMTSKLDEYFDMQL